MKLIRESKTSNIVAYHTHQGFGDLISCSPIVNYLSRANPSLKIVMITRSETYAKNIRRFCYPEVEVMIWENVASLYNAQVMLNPNSSLAQKRRIFKVFLKNYLKSN